MNLFGLLQDSVVGVGGAFQILDTEPGIVEDPNTASIDGVRDGLSFTNVTFTCERASELSLVDLTFEVLRASSWMGSND